MRRERSITGWLLSLTAVAFAAAVGMAETETSSPGIVESGKAEAGKAAAGIAETEKPATTGIAVLTGFGDLQFGSSVEEGKKAWPAMQPIGDDVKMPSAAFTSPLLGRFLVKEYAVPGLASPVDVELRYWEGKLWAFLVYFQAADQAAALQHLEKTYGPRTGGTETRPLWRGDKVSLQSMAEQGWYGATDNALSEQARSWFFAAITGNSQGNAPAAAAPVAASPPAPAAVAPPATAVTPAASPAP